MANGAGRLRLRPTMLGAKGTLFLGAIALAFFATSYSNLFFLLLAFLCTLAVLGAWWTVVNVRGVAVELRELPPAAAGSERDVELRVRATGRRTRFQLELAVEACGMRGETAVVARLDGEASARGRLRALPRGVHPVRRLWLRSRYPFGIVEVRRAFAVEAEAIAHPVPATLPPGDVRQALAAALGERSPMRGEDAVAGLRPFRTGDAVRDVHWKATARRGSPVVKERERHSGDVLSLVLDRRCEPNVLDEALGVATAALLAAAAGKEHVELRSQDHVAAYGQGQRPYLDALRWLAAAQPLPAGAPEPGPVPPGAVRLPGRRAATQPPAVPAPPTAPAVSTAPAGAASTAPEATRA